MARWGCGMLLLVWWWGVFGSLVAAGAGLGSSPGDGGDQDTAEDRQGRTGEARDTI